MHSISTLLKKLFEMLMVLISLWAALTSQPLYLNHCFLSLPPNLGGGNSHLCRGPSTKANALLVACKIGLEWCLDFVWVLYTGVNFIPCAQRLQGLLLGVCDSYTLHV